MRRRNGSAALWVRSANLGAFLAVQKHNTEEVRIKLLYSAPVTRRVYNSDKRIYTSMFRAPQWHGATQTRFPPRPRKSAWHCDITDVISPHGLLTHYKQSHHTIPPIIPLTSNTPHLHQHASRSPVARRHANALSTKAAQIRMVLRHHERNFATRSAHTLKAVISHETANDPAHQQHAAFTPACFAFPGIPVERT